MNSSHSTNNGTCVIGEIGSSAAFASVAVDGIVWSKRYSAVGDAVSESRHLGLVDKLFAVAAPRYIKQTRTPCVSLLASRVNREKLEAAGFKRTDGRAPLN